MTKIYLAKNHIMLVSGYANPKPHTHGAAHVLVALEGDFSCSAGGEKHCCRGILIPGNTPHTVDSGNRPMLVFLLDMSGSAARRITAVTEIPEAVTREIIRKYLQLAASADRAGLYMEFYKEMMKALGFTDRSIMSAEIRDERIHASLAYIDRHIGARLTARETARAVCLSESWFSHLFREQMGISFSGYVVMRKIYHTYLGVVRGKNITEAAMDAGFSSSAHFAAANKRLFGMTASDLAQEYELIIADGQSLA